MKNEHKNPRPALAGKGGSSGTTEVVISSDYVSPLTTEAALISLFDTYTAVIITGCICHDLPVGVAVRKTAPDTAKSRDGMRHSVIYKNT